MLRQGFDQEVFESDSVDAGFNWEVAYLAFQIHLYPLRRVIERQAVRLLQVFESVERLDVMLLLENLSGCFLNLLLVFDAYLLDLDLFC
jgi:hypothetical protein